MRARDLVFHVHCFSCAVCNGPLTKGDHFGMRDGAVLCRLHYFEIADNISGALNPTGIGAGNNNNNNNNNNSGVGGGLYGPPPGGLHHYPPPFPSPDFHSHHTATTPIPAQTPVEATGKVPFFNGAPTTPRQKGRPRKRKPKDLEGMTANLGKSSIFVLIPFFSELLSKILIF